MEHQFYKTAGISLILGSLLIIATMVMHPHGGSLEYLIKISNQITITHALAIFSIPIITFGFYGLTLKLLTPNKIAVLAFIILCFGFVAVMFAALINGLTLPYFLNEFADSLDANRAVVDPIVYYGFAINKPLDYIFMTGCCLAILLYSIIIVRSNLLHKWIGYFGILLIAFAVFGVLTGFIFTNLTGFRVFTFSLAAWILSSAVLLIRSK
ncbi:hypothetical protein [Seonamhaeicola marinus]|uniref:DUF4386 domain-containing protein n=1 Tax=Seonamhaeicola marinus TaxID=1912246 RepID=A0A5D0HTE2_9FLAO|nr:hypothetical protein [Seonamhaeicola marinus]TYA74624.1 hypothetical protein FUA24_15010 [Seonamhaeicola marinus]